MFYNLERVELMMIVIFGTLYMQNVLPSKCMHNFHHHLMQLWFFTTQEYNNNGMHAVFLPGRVNSVHAWFDSVALQNMLLLAENFTLKSSFQ